MPVIKDENFYSKWIFKISNICHSDMKMNLCIPKYLNKIYGFIFCMNECNGNITYLQHLDKYKCDLYQNRGKCKHLPFPRASKISGYSIVLVLLELKNIKN